MHPSPSFSANGQQFRTKLSIERQLTAFIYFLNSADSDPESQIYKKVQKNLRKLQVQLQPSQPESSNAQIAMAMATPVPGSGSGSPMDTATSASSPQTDVTDTNVPIPPIQATSSISSDATLPTASIHNNTVANTSTSLRSSSPDPLAHSVATASEVTPLQSSQLVSDGPFDAHMQFNSDEPADLDPDFETLAALPLSQLLARYPLMQPETSDDIQPPASQQQVSPDTGTTSATAHEENRCPTQAPDFQALTALPLSQLLARKPASQSETCASQQQQVSSDSGSAAEVAAEGENERPARATTPIETSADKASPSAKRKKTSKPKSPPTNELTPREKQNMEGLSSKQAYSRLRTPPENERPRVVRKNRTPCNSESSVESDTTLDASSPSCYQTAAESQPPSRPDSAQSVEIIAEFYGDNWHTATRHSRDPSASAAIALRGLPKRSRKSISPLKKISMH